MKILPPPVKSRALALYLLITSGKKGYTNFDAVKKDCFWKFNTRISELTRNPYNVFVRKYTENRTNRFGHSYTCIRYKIYAKDRAKYIKLYNKINVERKAK